MAGRAPIRYHPGGQRHLVRTATRRRRRTRLRTTAGPTARPIANATRGGEADGSGRKVHQSTPARARRPSAASRRKTSRSRMRQIKPTGGGGPCRGGPSARPGRHGCSSGDGSRASWHGVGCWVGTCASRHPPRWHSEAVQGNRTPSLRRRDTRWRRLREHPQARGGSRVAPTPLARSDAREHPDCGGCTTPEHRPPHRGHVFGRSSNAC